MLYDKQEHPVVYLQPLQQPSEEGAETSLAVGSPFCNHYTLTKHLAHPLSNLMRKSFLVRMQDTVNDAKLAMTKCSYLPIL